MRLKHAQVWMEKTCTSVLKRDSRPPPGDGAGTFIDCYGGGWSEHRAEVGGVKRNRKCSSRPE